MTGEERATGDDVFVIEQRGIDLVPQEARHGKPLDLFWMWLGTNLNVFYVVNGAIVIAIGLSFGQALVAILIGNLAFFAVGLTSLQGPDTGTSTFAVSRAAYGPNGGKGLSFFNWLTVVGFEASGIALIVLAGLELFSKAGVNESTALKAVLIFAAAAIQLVLPLFGHATILAAERWLSYLFTPLFVIMAILVAPKVHLGALSHGGTWADITIAVALVISAGGLSWANTGSDYSRYLPRDVDKKQVFWWSSVGGLLPGVLLEVLGAAVASVVATASDPIAGLPKALPGWVVVPYLVLAILTLFAVNTIDLYSSGLTLQAMGLPIKRWQAVLVDLAICIVVTFVAIFSSSFNRLYTEFLTLLIVWLAPWFAIYVVDWLLRRGRYDLVSLGRRDGGRYWRNGGFHIPGILAQALGMLAALMWIDSPAYIGPFSNRTQGSDFSVFMGILVAAIVYWLLAARSVRQEAGAAAPQAPPVATSAAG
jgi:purine-cytosine permease-like protein